MKLEDIPIAKSLETSITTTEKRIEDIEKSTCFSPYVYCLYKTKSGSIERVEVPSRYLNFDANKLNMLTCLRNELKDLKSKLERL